MSASPNPENGSPRNAVSPGLASAAASSARRRVRRLSQLEPVHIAALKQEYGTQIREAAKAVQDSPTQREHYDKAKKIKALLEKYDLMVQEQQRQRPHPEQILENESSPPSHSATPKTERSTSPPGPSISQQMAANTPRYNYSQQTSSQSEDLASNSAQYSQFRVQLSNGQGNAPTSDNPSGSASSTEPFYAKGAPSSISQYQQISSESLPLQLQRYKQMEREMQGQLDQVQRTMRETASADTDSRIKLRHQEQNLRTKRDQFKSMALQVTQQLQVQQQKQLQGTQKQSQDRGYPTNFGGTQSETSTKTYKYSASSVDSTSYGGNQSDSFPRGYDSPTAAQTSPINLTSPTESYRGTIPTAISQSRFMPTPSGPTSGIQGRSTLSTDESRSQSPTGYSHSLQTSNFQGTNSQKLSDTYKYSTQNLNKASSQPGKPIRIPGKVGRPPLASTLAAAAARRVGPTIPQLPSQNTYIPEKVYNKRKINELIKDLMPDDMEGVIENEVEDLVGDLVEEFVENVTKFSSRLAKHRKASHIEAKDVQVHLERNWNLRVFGFPGDEVNIIRKTVPSKSYLSKLDMINANKTYGGNGKSQ